MNTTKKQISDKEFEAFLPIYTIRRIGNQKEMIKKLREFGYETLEEFHSMAGCGGTTLGIQKIDDVYYW